MNSIYLQLLVSASLATAMPAIQMNFNSLSLLVLASLASAIPVIENGMRPELVTSEENIPDFAIFTDNQHGNLPSDFTICSSISTQARLGSLSPFQLLLSNGRPWITTWVYSAQKDSTHHRIIFYVSKCE